MILTLMDRVLVNCDILSPYAAMVYVAAPARRRKSLRCKGLRFGTAFAGEKILKKQLDWQKILLDSDDKYIRIG